MTYIAEYTRNPERHPVRIWRSHDFTRFEVAWEFKAGSIRHVHALIRDPQERNRIWILTGDLDHESTICTTADEFASMDGYLSIGQRSRAVDLVFMQDNLIWGMDSPNEVAYLLAHRRFLTEEPKKLCELPGPAYYSMQNEAGGIYFGTTVEPGNAVRDNFVHIIGLGSDGKWAEIYRSKSDMIPQFAIVQFPRGKLPENWVVYSQRATSSQEGYMFIGRDLAWSS